MREILRLRAMAKSPDICGYLMGQAATLIPGWWISTRPQMRALRI
jgi:hypothetical protein